MNKIEGKIYLYIIPQDYTARKHNRGIESENLSCEAVNSEFL